jgi:predicted nuclease of predicted toxin-antitoxin system
MRFLVDEFTGSTVARWLRDQGYEVFSVYDEARGISDDDVLQKAFIENWILVTNDKDFGDKIFREGSSHRGIIFLRLDNERAANKIKKLQLLL